VGKPSKIIQSHKLYPYEARMSGSTYSAPMNVDVNFQLDDGTLFTLQKNVGRLPIMVKSLNCHLYGLEKDDLLKHKEEENEFGGYFIVNGIEKIIRLLFVQRRNYPLCMKRRQFAQSGKEFTEYAASIRCAKLDQSSHSFALHFLKTGSCYIRFNVNRSNYFLPAVLVMRAFIDTTDREIYERIVQGDVENTFLTDRVENMLLESRKMPYYTKKQCLEFIGSRFRY
jgi:DNA-directed RNA polymerase I subunit RPA2